MEYREIKLQAHMIAAQLTFGTADNLRILDLLRKWELEDQPVAAVIMLAAVAAG
jgi:hypothetical protein